MGTIREPKGVDFEINNSKGFSPTDKKLMLAQIAAYKAKNKKTLAGIKRKKMEIHPLETLRKITQKAIKKTGITPKPFKRK